ncbi:MAG: septum formation protein Maf [Oscillospiraceae bacterium]|nr:septum formation protein Maf [Oscillospiraceae bacterium]
MNLILASKSPRRIELLKQIHPDFTVEPAKGEEIVPAGATPAETVMALAKAKAEEVAVRHPNDLVVGSDTIVAIDQQILGKPRNHEHCVEMIRQLSGRRHQVYTGVALALNDKTECFYDVTEVEFYPLSEEEIQWYASLEEPYDKAGGYGIQGKGSLLVKGIRGDYFNVMGFPVALAARKMRPYFDFTKNR